MSPTKKKPDGQKFPHLNPFRRAVLRGLALLLPPLLTIVIFLWMGNTVAEYLLVPLESFARSRLLAAADVRPVTDEMRIVKGATFVEGNLYHETADGNLVPGHVYEAVRSQLGQRSMPSTADAIYARYIDQEWLRREFVVPVFVCLLVLALYLLGKFMAAGVGRFFWYRLEQIIHRVPLVRNVYGSVKQVTDFLFSDAEVEYTRVVAIEYPRKGIWTLAMVTGESLLDIRSAANEPVLSVLVPTSPMPFTGFTVTVRKSETVDLNITIDQAFQFIVSCGVVVPPHQLVEALEAKHETAMPTDSLDPTPVLSAPLTSPDEPSR